MKKKKYCLEIYDYTYKVLFKDTFYTLPQTKWAFRNCHIFGITSYYNYRIYKI
jgi:hypothetical protein